MTFNKLNNEYWQEFARFLCGEMNIGEYEVFQNRLKESDESRVLLSRIKLEWEKMENFRQNNNDFDTSKAWNKLHDKFEKDGLINPIQNQKVFKLRNILQMAAIFIGILGISGLVYFQFTASEKQEYIIADTYNNTSIKEIKLSDGSIVFMNADSKLYYPEKFDGNSRIVEFEGDAFFDIAKNPSKPFIIKAKKAEIKVLGTSFNVNTNFGIDDVEVLVETGTVQLNEIKKNKKPVYINSGYIGKLHKNELSLRINSDLNYLSWKTKYFNFENVKLGNAIDILNRAYHANIQCNDKKIAGIKWYGTFNNEEIESILKVLCETFNLKTIKSEGGILLLPQ
jgi:transmembrane sensor